MLVLLDGPAVVPGRSWVSIAATPAAAGNMFLMFQRYWIANAIPFRIDLTQSILLCLGVVFFSSCFGIFCS